MAQDSVQNPLLVLPSLCILSQAEYTWQISEILDKCLLMWVQAYVEGCSDNYTDVGVHHQVYEQGHPMLMSCSSDCEDFHLKETSDYLNPIMEKHCDEGA